MEFIYFVITRMLGEKNPGRLRSMLSLCGVFWTLINSLLCWYLLTTSRQVTESVWKWTGYAHVTNNRLSAVVPPRRRAKASVEPEPEPEPETIGGDRLAVSLRKLRNTKDWATRCSRWRDFVLRLKSQRAAYSAQSFRPRAENTSKARRTILHLVYRRGNR